MGSGGPIISETGKQCYSATVPQLRCWLQSRPGSRTAHSPLGHGWLVVTTNRPDNQPISHAPHRLQRVSCLLVEYPSNNDQLTDFSKLILRAISAYFVLCCEYGIELCTILYHTLCAAGTSERCRGRTRRTC